MKSDQIVDAATAVLAREGLTGWSVNAVALEANCAKGLVHYHHRTKRDLLAAVADRLAHRRRERRARALAPGGTAALDRLFDVLLSEVRRGEAAAWLALLVSPEIRSGTGDLPLGSELAAALGLAPFESDSLRAIAATLDGLQVQLLDGADQGAVREAYHRSWLTWI